VKRIIAIGLLVAAAVAAGCGGGDDGPGSGGASQEGGGGSGASNGGGGGSGGRAAAGGAGKCQVKVSGDETVDFQAEGGLGAVGTDYWLKEEEIRAALNALATGSDAEKKQQVDEQMAEDPRIMLLILNCGSAGAENSISLLPSNDSKYADVPFKPGEYTIPSGQAFVSAGKPGEFAALLSLKEASYSVSEPGKLTISKFDKSGIAGSFQFGAAEVFAEGTPKKVQVQGTFDFPCAGGGNCSR
jgi:hypothetical protein